MPLVVWGVGPVAEVEDGVICWWRSVFVYWNEPGPIGGSSSCVGWFVVHMDVNVLIL